MTPDRIAELAHDGIEIERTYLLRRLPELPAASVACRIEQGYLPPAEGKPETVEGRIRRLTRPDGQVECTHTVKKGLGLVRSEQERVIDAEEFERLWPRTAGRRLKKTRHMVPERALLWTIDDFDDLDLVLAEVELPDAKTAVEIPAWLAPHVERDVTEEPEYRNYELALRAGIVGDSATAPSGRSGREGPPSRRSRHR
jgi:CYTH domain-containing protein